MFAWVGKSVGILGISISVLLLRGVAKAESAKAPGGQSTLRLVPEAVVQRRLPSPETGVGKLTEIGLHLKEAQPQMDTAASRTQDLDQQMRKLSKDLEPQRRAASDSQARLDERTRAAYKGEDLAGISLVPDSIGGDAEAGTWDR